VALRSDSVALRLSQAGSDVDSRGRSGVDSESLAPRSESELESTGGLGVLLVLVAHCQRLADACQCPDGDPVYLDR